jgi:hypothetical protein
MGREHHFVPQFYLRNFSYEEKSINLFNLALGKVINSASIKHQCSKRGMYDFNAGVEEAFAEIEGRTADVFRRIISDGYSISLSKAEFAVLMLFVILQRSRTVAAAKEDDELTDWFIKLRAAGDPKLDGLDLSKYRICSRYPSAIPVSVAAGLLPEVLDLKYRILLNNTGEELITSDNPLIVHNRFAEGVSNIGVDGWGCRGIQAILPISPERCLLIFDGDVYNVGTHNKTYAQIDKKAVISLNKFQILNASHNVYFRNPELASVIARRVQSLIEARKQPRVRYVRTVSVEREDGKYSELVSHYRPLLPCKLNLDRGGPGS